jgi:branched-chain amino acid transport system permease protein
MADTSAPSAGWFEFARRHRAALASLFVLIFPLVMPFTALAANILIYGLYALGFNLLFGFLGLLSFGHSALFGTGAYLCGIAIVHFGLPWYAAIVIGTLSGALMATAIGALAIRTRGIYFAMVTMALSQCVYYLFYQAVDWTGGENGLRGINVHVIDIFGLKFDFINPLTRYYVIAAFVILALFALSRILASPFGPMIEVMAPRGNAAEMLLSARNLPNILLTPWVRRITCELSSVLMA